MGTEPEQLVDWTVYRAARSGLGGGFVRILGYFREDGTKSVAAIEQAMREKNAAALVLPSHTLKGESRQFGADQLASLAEDIEMFARECVEDRSPPDEYLEKVVALRPLFEETLDALETEANPLVQRQRPSFGSAAATNQILRG